MPLTRFLLSLPLFKGVIWLGEKLFYVSHIVTLFERLFSVLMVHRGPKKTLLRFDIYHAHLGIIDLMIDLHYSHYILTYR